MSEDGVQRLNAAADRLEVIAAELTADGVDDPAAVKLAREAAEIAAEAGATAAEAARLTAERGEPSGG